MGFELPTWAEMAVAVAVSSSAVAIITSIGIFVLLHSVFYKLLPLYGFILSVGILINYPGSLNYAHPSLKSLQLIKEGAFLLKVFALLLMGYSAAVYHVGKSECGRTKSFNALVFTVGATGVLFAMLDGVTLSELVGVCISKTEAFRLLGIILASFVVAVGHFLGPYIEAYLSSAGCSARTKIVVNSHGLVAR